MRCATASTWTPTRWRACTRILRSSQPVRAEGPSTSPSIPRGEWGASARRRPEHREPVLLVGPVDRCGEAGGFEQRAKTLDRVLVRVLGVDALACGETALRTVPADHQ